MNMGLQLDTIEGLLDLRTDVTEQFFHTVGMILSSRQHLKSKNKGKTFESRQLKSSRAEIRYNNTKKYIRF